MSVSIYENWIYKNGGFPEVLTINNFRVEGNLEII